MYELHATFCCRHINTHHRHRYICICICITHVLLTFHSMRYYRISRLAILCTIYVYTYCIYNMNCYYNQIVSSKLSMGKRWWAYLCSVMRVLSALKCNRAYMRMWGNVGNSVTTEGEEENRTTKHDKKIEWLVISEWYGQWWEGTSIYIFVLFVSSMVVIINACYAAIANVYIYNIHIYLLYELNTYVTPLTSRELTVKCDIKTFSTIYVFNWSRWVAYGKHSSSKNSIIFIIQKSFCGHCKRSHNRHSYKRHISSLCQISSSKCLLNSSNETKIVSNENSRSLVIS